MAITSSSLIAISLSLSLGALTAAGAERTESAGVAQTSFRVRSDFRAPLNFDQGWAGTLNENVTINADQPFRLRFEVELAAQPVADRRFRLHYRRNQESNWTQVEAHDFPHPEAEVQLDFDDDEIGTSPKDWNVAQGGTTHLKVVADGNTEALQAHANQAPLIALYTPPWESKDFAFATEIRLSAENANEAGLIFGYVNPQNYSRVFLDTGADAIRVSRMVDGQETLLAERNTELPSGEWLPLEIELEDRKLKVAFRDDALAFTLNLAADVPPSPLGLYVPQNGTVEIREIEIEGHAQTPRVSIVRCAAYENGQPTTNLLHGSTSDFLEGTGVSMSPRTPPWKTAGGQGEFEWALVVRRFIDGGFTNDEGDTFEFKMIEEGTTLTSKGAHPVLRLVIPPGHVGGTFVETPGRIGPWQASNGDLYFIMEPAETSNLFMMIKSTDEGRTWREVDGTNRPRTSDLESVDSRQVGNTIHIVHQVTKSTRHHSFRTSDHPTSPDTWDVRDEQGAAANSVAQGASLVVRSDGSMVAFYVGQTIHYSIRSASGIWGQQTIIDHGMDPKLAGPQAVLGAADVVHLAYYAMDGSLWYRRLLPDGILTPKEQLAAGLGATRAEFGSALPLVFMPGKNTAVIIFRGSDGKLWERRIVNNGSPTPAVRVSDRDVVLQAVDSQQPGADVVWDGDTVHVLFIEDASRSIFSTHDKGGWQSSTPRVDAIQGSWVRGNIYTRRDRTKVYGFIYDAGSQGGAGMNRFGQFPLN